MSGTASAGVLSVLIRADDRASLPMLKVGATAQRVATRMGALGDRVRNLGGLDKLSAGARSVTRAFEGIAPSIAALTAAGTLAGVTALAVRFASFGSELGRTSYRVQTSVADLHALQGAARLSGASADTAAAAMEGLGSALLDATAGRDTNAAMYLNQLGIAMRNTATGGARLAKDVLPEVANAIAKIGDPRIQANVMAALRIPAGALPWIRKGAAGLEEYTRKAREYGVVTANGAAIAAKFEYQQATLNLAFDGMVQTIGEKLAPQVGGIIERMSEWIRVNRLWIANGLSDALVWLEQKVTSAYAAVKAWADDGGWARLKETLSGVGDSLREVFSGNALSGAETWITRIDRLVRKVEDWRVILQGIRSDPLTRWWFDLDPVAPPAPGSIFHGPAQPENPGGPTAPGSAPFTDWFRSVLPSWLGGGPQGNRTAPGRGEAPELDADMIPVIRAAAQRNNVPEDFALAIARAEAGRRNGVDQVSPTGAIGQMQLMPGTARDLGVNPWDRDQNVEGGVRYLRQMLDKFGNNLSVAAAAYNAGPNSGAVSQYARNGSPTVLPIETQGYINRVGRYTSPREQSPMPTPPPPPPGAPVASPGPAQSGAPGAPLASSGPNPNQRVDVRVRLEGPGSEGATVTTRTADGGVRIERSMSGAFG